MLDAPTTRTLWLLALASATLAAASPRPASAQRGYPPAIPPIAPAHTLELEDAAMAQELWRLLAATTPGDENRWYIDPADETGSVVRPRRRETSSIVRVQSVAQGLELALAHDGLELHVLEVVVEGDSCRVSLPDVRSDSALLLLSADQEIELPPSLRAPGARAAEYATTVPLTGLRRSHPRHVSVRASGCRAYLLTSPLMARLRSQTDSRGVHFSLTPWELTYGRHFWAETPASEWRDSGNYQIDVLVDGEPFGRRSGLPLTLPVLDGSHVVEGRLVDFVTGEVVDRERTRTRSLQTLTLELHAGLGESCVTLGPEQSAHSPARYADPRVYPVPDRSPNPMRAGDRICGHASLTARPDEERSFLQSSYSQRHPPLELVIVTRSTVPAEAIYLGLVAFGLLVFGLLLWAQRRPDRAAPRLAWEVPSEGGYRGGAAEWRSCAIPDAPEPAEGHAPRLERLDPSLAGVGHRVHQAPGGRVEFVPEGRVVVVREAPYPPLLYVSAVTVEPGMQLVDEDERRFLIVSEARAKRLEEGDVPPALDRALTADVREGGLQGELELAPPLGRWRPLPIAVSGLFAFAVAAAPMAPSHDVHSRSFREVSPHLWGWAGFGGALAFSILLAATATLLVRRWARRDS